MTTITTLTEVQLRGRDYARALRRMERAKSVLREAVLNAVEDGHPEARIAREAGVDRMTVRSWQGKRDGKAK